MERERREFKCNILIFVFCFVLLFFVCVWRSASAAWVGTRKAKVKISFFENLVVLVKTPEDELHYIFLFFWGRDANLRLSLL